MAAEFCFVPSILGEERPRGFEGAEMKIKQHIQSFRRLNLLLLVQIVHVLVLANALLEQNCCSIWHACHFRAVLSNHTTFLNNTLGYGNL